MRGLVIKLISTKSKVTEIKWTITTRTKRYNVIFFISQALANLGFTSKYIKAIAPRIPLVKNVMKNLDGSFA